jgi:hypothetical protein
MTSRSRCHGGRAALNLAHTCIRTEMAVMGARNTVISRHIAG